MSKKVTTRVRFHQPDFDALDRDGYAAVDMHFHTNHSDSPTRVKDALKYAQKKGTGVAVTDHNAIGGVEEAFKERKDVLLVPGVEVSANDGPHILLYFYSLSEMREYYRKHIEREKRRSPYLAIRLGSEEIIDSTEDYNCVRVAAHPYGYLMFNKGLQKCIEGAWLDQDLLNRFQAVEAICGGMVRNLNLKAAELAKTYKRGITGGSDGHLLRDLGTVVTCSHAQNPEDFLEDIVKHRSLAIGEEKNAFEKCFMGTVVLTKYLRYTVPSLQIHYQQNMPRLRRYFTRPAKG
jgi:hypothetical protein